MRTSRKVGGLLALIAAALLTPSQTQALVHEVVVVGFTLDGPSVHKRVIAKNPSGPQQVVVLWNCGRRGVENDRTYGRIFVGVNEPPVYDDRTVWWASYPCSDGWAYNDFVASPGDTVWWHADVVRHPDSPSSRFKITSLSGSITVGP